MGDEVQHDQTQENQSAPPPVAGGRGWTNGLFGCFGDCKICIITYIAPCYTSGKNAEAVGEDCLMHAVYALLPGLNIFCGAKIREKIREQKGIDGTFVMDCVMHWFCPICAVVQEAREVSANTIDLAIDRY